MVQVLLLYVKDGAEIEPIFCHGVCLGRSKKLPFAGGHTGPFFGFKECLSCIAGVIYLCDAFYKNDEIRIIQCVVVVHGRICNFAKKNHVAAVVFLGHKGYSSRPPWAQED